MKQAKLKNGVIITFPDDTPGHIVDAAVKKYLGLDGEKEKTEQIAAIVCSLQEASKALADTTKAISLVAGALIESINEGAEQVATSQKDMAKSIAAIATAIRDNGKVSDVINKGAGDNQKKVSDALQKVVEGITHLLKAEDKANELRAAQIEATSKPRHAVITDNKGTVVRKGTVQ